MIAGFELIKLTAWMIRQTMKLKYEWLMKTAIEIARKPRKDKRINSLQWICLSGNRLG